jgi:hypothetical protein
VTWIGKWQNQWGSIIDITNDADGRIEEAFGQP